MATMAITEGDEKEGGSAFSRQFRDRYGKAVLRGGPHSMPDGSGMIRVLREKIIVQAMLRLSCRRYIEALCSQDEARARSIFHFYKRLERLGSRLAALDGHTESGKAAPGEAGKT